MDQGHRPNATTELASSQKQLESIFGYRAADEAAEQLYQGHSAASELSLVMVTDRIHYLTVLNFIELWSSQNSHTATDQIDSSCCYQSNGA